MSKIDKINIGVTSGMPIRINRPSVSSHIPYSINKIPESLTSRIEVQRTNTTKETTLVDYPEDPTKPGRTVSKIDGKIVA
jgi:hypothetical protein